MNSINNFCQFKTAYLITNNFPNVMDAIIDHTIFDLFNDIELPLNWEFTGTDISGAAGFVLVFEIEDGIPTKKQMLEIDKIIKKLEVELGE